MNDMEKAAAALRNAKIDLEEKEAVLAAAWGAMVRARGDVARASGTLGFSKYCVLHIAETGANYEEMISTRLKHNRPPTDDEVNALFPTKTFRVSDSTLLYPLLQAVAAEIGRNCPIAADAILPPE